MKTKIHLYNYLISFLLVSCAPVASTPYPTPDNGELLTNTPATTPTNITLEPPDLEAGATKPSYALSAKTKFDLGHLFNSNCRVGPDPRFTSLTKIPPNTDLEVLNKSIGSGDWFLVKWDKIPTECWIDSSLLDYDFDPTTLQVSTEIIPTPLVADLPDRVDGDHDEGKDPISTQAVLTPSSPPTATPCWPPGHCRD